MKDNLKIRKVRKGNKFLMEIYDTNTDCMITLGKWDLWNMWCEVVR